MELLVQSCAAGIFTFTVASYEMLRRLVTTGLRDHTLILYVATTLDLILKLMCRVLVMVVVFTVSPSAALVLY